MKNKKLVLQICLDFRVVSFSRVFIIFFILLYKSSLNGFVLWNRIKNNYNSSDNLHSFLSRTSVANICFIDIVTNVHVL